MRRVPNRQITIASLKKSRLYSEELDIALRKRDDREFFKWFLASLLFGGRIAGTIAKNTYRAFERQRLLTPRKLLNAGWDFLVNPIMREGGYVRYDGRKSTQILRDCEMLIGEYQGSLKKLHRQAKSCSDLENKLLMFYGVGPVTVNVFLRELRPFWSKANPQPMAIVRDVAKKLKLHVAKYDRQSIEFCRIEAGLIRLRKILK